MAEHLPMRLDFAVRHLEARIVSFHDNGRGTWSLRDVSALRVVLRELRFLRSWEPRS